MFRFKKVLDKICGSISFEKEGSLGVTDDEQLLREAVVELREMQARLAYVQDPYMIDYVIYSIKAAEKRYEYLLRQVKDKKTGNPARKSVKLT